MADHALMIWGDTLRWYRSSEHAERGFCSDCGTYLFWRYDGEGATSFSLGSPKDTSSITLEKHIFVADKGDYYTISDGLPQKD